MGDAEDDGGIDLRRSAATQDLGAFFQSRAGGPHVVDKKQTGIAQGRAVFESESPAHVGRTLQGRKSDLVWTGSHAAKEGNAREVSLSSDEGGEGVGGVEGTMQTPPPVGGDGDDGLDPVAPGGGIHYLGEPVAEQRSEFLPAVVFVRPQHSAQHASVTAHAHRPGHLQRTPAAVAAAVELHFVR